MAWIPRPNRNPSLPSLRVDAAGLEHDFDEEGRPLPEHEDASWRYRKDGAPKTFALVGVAVGFVLLIVPGIFALRSYRRWQDGVRPEPTFAWSITALTVAAPVVVVAFIAAPGLGILVGIFAVLAALFLVRPTS